MLTLKEFKETLLYITSVSKEQYLKDIKDACDSLGIDNHKEFIIPKGDVAVMFWDKKKEQNEIL